MEMTANLLWWKTTLSRWHKHKILREGESRAVSGNGVQAEELLMS